LQIPYNSGQLNPTSFHGSKIITNIYRGYPDRDEMTSSSLLFLQVCRAGVGFSLTLAACIRPCILEKSKAKEKNHVRILPAL